MKLLKPLLFFSFLVIFYLPIVNALPNPAAVYCRDLGYEYEIVKAPSGEYGICILPDKTCRGWKFFSGECGKEYSYCAKQGYDLITKTDGKNPYSPKYAVCVYTKGKNKGKEVGAVSDLLNFDTRFEGYEFRIEEESAVLEQTFTPITEATDGLPSYFDWRDATLDVDGHGVPGNGIGFDWMTPVGDQGTCGDCWNFPATGAVEADARIEYNDLSLYLDCSEQDVLSCGGAGSCASGSSILALKYIRDTGVVDETCFPRTGIDANGCDYYGCGYPPTSCSDKCSDWWNSLFTIYSYGAVPDIPADMKNILINEGPIVIYMYWGAGSYDGNGIWTCGSSGSVNHAAVLVGYDDIGEYWVLKNSWGSDWGWNGDGYLKLAYGSCNLDARVYVNTCSDAYPDTCYDSDGGIDPMRTGTVSGYECGEYYYYKDHCKQVDPEGTEVLREYYCDGIRWAVKEYYCRYGFEKCSLLYCRLKCAPSGSSCTSDSSCCSGYCSDGVCRPATTSTTTTPSGGGGGMPPRMIMWGISDVLGQPIVIISVLVIIIVVYGFLKFVATKK